MFYIKAAFSYKSNIKTIVAITNKYKAALKIAEKLGKMNQLIDISITQQSPLVICDYIDLTSPPGFNWRTDKRYKRGLNCER